MHRKILEATGALSLLITVSSTAAPRLTHISEQAQIPYRVPLVVDLFVSGRPDIFFNSLPGSSRYLEDNALIIQNLGGRNFANPRLTNFRFSTGGFTDGVTSLASMGSLTSKALFFNEVQATTSGGISTPKLIQLDTTGGMQPRRALAPPSQSSWVPVDLDGDGVSEFLEVGLNADAEPELLIHDRQMNGSYSSTIVALSSNISLGDLTAIDLDGDGDFDLSSSPGINQAGITILERTGVRGFSPTLRFVSNVPHEYSFADLNGDGLLDICSRSGAPFTYFVNLGGLSFESLQTRELALGSTQNRELMQVVSQAGVGATLRFSGFKNSHIDLVSIRFGTWETLADQVINIAGVSQITPAPQMLALQDFDEDGIDDALTVSTTQLPGYLNSSARRLCIAWGNGTGFSPAAFINPAPISTYIHVTGEFDSEPGEDLVIGPDMDGKFSFLRNTGEGSFPLVRKIDEIKPPSSAPEGTFIAQIHAGDIDGDGRCDLAIEYQKFISGEGYRTACGIAKGNGDGTFTAPTLPTTAFGIIMQHPCRIDNLVDWDGDGDLDAIGGGEWRENISGRFDGTYRTLITGSDTTDLFGNPVKILLTHVGDLDGDGAPDIASLVYRITHKPNPGAITGGAPFSSTMAIAFNDGNGGIASITELAVTLAALDLFGNPITSYAVFADMNSDGLPDLVTSELGSSDIFGNIAATITSWWRNPGGASSRNPASWTKLPFRDVAVPSGPMKDFDGDGILEWVSPSGFLRPTPQGPLASPIYNFSSPVNLASNNFLLVGDFDGDDDADFLFGLDSYDMVLVQNTIVDERSAITRALLDKGVKGALAGPDQDADSDGRSNFSEIFFNTNPTVRDEVTEDPFKLWISQDTSGVVLHYYTPANAWPPNAISTTYEMSEDLKNWVPVTATAPETATLQGEDVSRAVTFPPCNSPAMFYRIKGTHLANP